MTDPIIPRIITFGVDADLGDHLEEIWQTPEEANTSIVVYVIPLIAECAMCDSMIDEFKAAYLLRHCQQVICQKCFNNCGIVLDQFSQERIIATEELYT